MTPKQFRAVGEALRGPSWQSKIAKDLGISARHVRRYLSQERAIPDTLATRLATLLIEHAGKLIKLAAKIDGGT